MSNWPVQMSAAPRFVGANSPDGVSAVVTTSAAITPSAWVEVVSAIPAGIVGFHLTVRTASARRCVVELGIGASGSEVLLARLPFLANGTQDSGTDPDYHHPTIFFPLALPSGVRLAARLSAPDTGVEARLSMYLQPASPLAPMGFSRVSLQGFDDATNFLSTITANSTSYGAWVELVASAGFRVRGVMFLCSTGWPSAGANYAARTEHQLGIGASGSEVAVYARPVGMLYTDWPVPIYSPLLPVDWPAGTRIAAQCRVDSGNLWEHTAGVLLFG